MSSAGKVIKIAAAEIGYPEKATNSNLDSPTQNAGYNNYTKYARDIDAIPHFYNGPKQGYPWCTVSLAWWFIKAFDVDEAKRLLLLPKDSLGAGVYYFKRYFRDAGQLGTTPKVGALVFFGDDHTGIVTAVNGGGFSTIEGNTSKAKGVVANGGSVCAKSYSSVKSSWTFGYPAYTEVDEDKPKVYLSPAMHRQNECCYPREDGQQCYEALENNEYIDILEPILNRCGIDTLRGYRRTPMDGEDGEQIMYNNINAGNAWKPDVYYVSHTNASTNGKTGSGTAKGFSSMYYPGSGNGQKLAKLMVQHRSEIYPYSCKTVARSDLHELSDTDAPAVYQEHVFHDNPEDAKWFHEHMKECAEADARALCEYLGIAYVDEPKTEPEKNILYRVQVGAFRVKANAEAQLEKLKAAGFDGFIVEVEK